MATAAGTEAANANSFIASSRRVRIPSSKNLANAAAPTTAPENLK
jgi:hypothetical protein